MIRNATESDYDYIITRLDEWWGGRNMSAMLPRLFFQHFQNSSFIYEIENKIAGFLIGFESQSVEGQGYVHFVGVDPQLRKQHIASKLYSSFFDFCKASGIKTVKCITSPINKTSIAFHQKLGFRATMYDVHGDPIPIGDYDAPGEPRVVFSKSL